MWRIWRDELRASAFWSALCKLLSGRDLAPALERARRWFYDNPR
jgi:hypothetical protein